MRDQLHIFSRKALRGHYAAAWRAAMLRLTVWIVTALLPPLLAGCLISRGSLRPTELFSGRLWMLFTALWSMTAFCIRLPVQCGVRSWFTSLVELEMPGQPRRFFPTVRAYLRAIGYFAVPELLRLLMALPLCAAGALTLLALRQSSGLTEGGLWLFAAVQGLAALLWTAWLYLRFCMGLAAVPYLFLSRPELSPLRAVRASERMLAGKRLRLCGVVLPYAVLPPVLPVLLPCLMTDLTLFLQLRIREYFQEVEGVA